METVNPLAAFREGYETTQGLFDAQRRRKAGNALAMGDYRQGANALLGGGMLGEGTDLLNYDQRNRQAQAEAMRAQEQAAKAAQAESLKTMLGGAQSLLQLPPEQRGPAWQSQVRPLLQQQGVPDELLTQFDQSGFTDGELQPFVTTLGGELDKPEWQIVATGNGGVVAVNKADPSQTRMVAESQRPPRYVEAQDGLWVEQSDGSWKRAATFAPQAKTFAPKAARSGSGQTYSDVPADAVVVR